MSGGIPAVEIDPGRLLDLVSRGLTNTQLTAEFGCSVRTLDRWRRRNPKINEQVLALRGRRPAASRKPIDLTQPHRARADCYHQNLCPQEACRLAYNAYQTGRRQASGHPARRDIEVLIARGWSAEGIAAKLADRDVTVEVVRRVWAAWDEEVGVTSMPLAG